MRRRKRVRTKPEHDGTFNLNYDNEGVTLMPTYEYECTKCQRVTELFQPITEKPRRKLKQEDNPACDCDAPVVRRIGTGGGVIFKGSGFYQTDYRSDGYKKAAEADKPDAAKKMSDATSETKKPEKKQKETKAD